MRRSIAFRLACTTTAAILVIAIYRSAPVTYAGSYAPPVSDYRCQSNIGQACPAWNDGTYCNYDPVEGTYSGVMYYCDVSTQPSECTAGSGMCQSYVFDGNNDMNACGFQLDCDGDPIYQDNVQVKCTQHFSMCT